MEVGKRIKYYRDKKDWGTRELASRVGISAGYLSQIETSKRKPNVELLGKIANALDVELVDLFGEKQEMPSELADIGVEWIAFTKEMKEKGLTPEEIKNIVNVVQSLNKDTK